MRDGQTETPARLKLHATDGDDLTVVSAALSSATVKRGDMGYDRRKRRFAFVCNRFRWEGGLFEEGGGSRIRSGVQFNDIHAVRQSGLSMATAETVLELLSIQADPGDSEPECTLTLNFAGGVAVQLQAGCVDVLVDDMGRAWYTPNRPQHGDDDQGGN